MDTNVFINVDKVDHKRSTNFSTQEIDTLLKLVENKKGTIECKKTDRTSSEDKQRSWMEIESEFNSTFNKFRPYKTLKTKYDNLKKEAKKNFALDKQEMYRTGGGPKPASKVTVFDDNILKIVQQEQITGHESIYDDDKVENDQSYETQAVETEDISDKHFDIRIENSNECIVLEKSSQDHTNWKNYSPNMLKTPKHQALNTGDKRKTKDVWADVAEKKIKKYDLEMKITQEEWELKKNKFNLEIEELQQKIELNKLELKSKQTLQNKNNQSDISQHMYPKEF